MPLVLKALGHPHPYDPFQLQDEVLLASIFGGVVIGIGAGLILKTRSSSGGTDVLSSILNKLTIFLMGKVIDIVIQGYSSDKTFFIVSEKTEEIRHYILTELHRGGSIVPVNGMFNRSEKEMIMTVVNRKELCNGLFLKLIPKLSRRLWKQKRSWEKDLKRWNKGKADWSGKICFELLVTVL